MEGGIGEGRISQIGFVERKAVVRNYRKKIIQGAPLRVFFLSAIISGLEIKSFSSEKKFSTTVFQGSTAF